MEQLDLINDKIDRLDAKIDKLYDNQLHFCERVAKLEVKAGFWGAVGGMFVAILAYFGNALK